MKSDQPRYKIDRFEKCLPSSPPQHEIAAAVYKIAEIMGYAPMNATGNRVKEHEAIVKELVGKGIPTATARDAISWAWTKDVLRPVSRPGEYPEILTDTITLQQIGNGEFADLFGPRPQDKIKTGQTDSKTDNQKISLPDSPDVKDLCHRLQKEIPKGRSQVEIALEFTGQNKQKADSLLRQARRFRHLWQ